LIVVNTNVLASLLLHGPRTEQAEILMLAQPQWAAPPLQRSEWRNVLTSVLRRDLRGLGAGAATGPSSRCSAYDCEFVAAAPQLGVPLATEDRAILAAFPHLARSLDQFNAASQRSQFGA
jgi:predicted nucleic acid-binding protein